MRLDRALLPDMLERVEGVVIHVTSIQSRLMPPPMRRSRLRCRHTTSVYQSRFRARIRVLRVSLGWVEKNESSVALAERLAQEASTEVGKQIIMQAQRGIPLARPAKPSEVADLIAYLASLEGDVVISADNHEFLRLSSVCI